VSPPNPLQLSAKLLPNVHPNGHRVEGIASATANLSTCFRGLRFFQGFLLVGGAITILKNMKVNGKDDIPYMKWKKNV
jgi:hypothetical protein